MELSTIIQDRTDQLQKECQNFINELIKKGTVGNYQDLTNVWLCIKLAQIQLDIESIKKSLLNKIQKTLRQKSLTWWNIFNDEQQTIFTNTHYPNRHHKSLTGREIEKMYTTENYFTQQN